MCKSGDIETIARTMHLEARDGAFVTDEQAVEAQRLEEALEWTLEALAPTVDEFRSSHDDIETVLGVKRDFINLAYVRMSFGGTYILSDYVQFGMGLLRLLDARKQIAELTEQVAFRDSVINALGELGDMQ